MMLAADVSWKVKASGLQKVHTRAQLCLIWLSRNRLFRHERCCTRMMLHAPSCLSCVPGRWQKSFPFSAAHATSSEPTSLLFKTIFKAAHSANGVTVECYILSLLFYCRLCRRRRCRAGCIINPIFARPEATVSSIKSIFPFVPTLERTYFPSHLIWEILLRQKLLQNLACKFKMRWSWLFSVAPEIIFEYKISYNHYKNWGWMSPFSYCLCPEITYKNHLNTSNI